MVAALVVLVYMGSLLLMTITEKTADPSFFHSSDSVLIFLLSVLPSSALLQWIPASIFTIIIHSHCSHITVFGLTSEVSS